MSAKNNIAARAARWSATHRKLAIFGWLAFVVASLAIGGAVGQKNLTDAEAGSGESGRAALALERSHLNPNDEMVLVQSDHLSADAPAFQAAVREVTERLHGIRAVKSISSPADGGGQVSADGHSALVEFQLPGSKERAEEKVDASLAATAAVQARHLDLRVQEFGGASASKALEKVFADDLGKAETTSLPITLLILLVAFGALVAALVPLLISFSAVLATMGLLALPSQLVPMDPSVSSVVVLVGLAVGVDYSLFYMRREREERRAGRSASAALEASAATAGRAVLVSGLTVITAMAGMLLSGSPTFTSFAVGTMTVVAVAMFASLSVLPAVLSKLGDKVELGRVPFLGRWRRRRRGRTVWGSIVERVMRHPRAALVASVGVLVALAIPALGMHTVVSGAGDLPRSVPVVQTYDHINEAFPGEGAGATVVVEAADVSRGPVAAAIADLRHRAQVDRVVAGDVSLETSENGRVASIEIPTVGTDSDATATAAMERIRSAIVPAAFDGVAAAEVNTTGLAAESSDFNDQLAQRMPLVFAFVLGFAFLLMLVTFRSIVVPIKAIVLNLLSVGAAYGVLVLVFQRGLGESLLGFHSNGGVSSWLPLFLFVILFGLSMDYHVLILSRVREYVDRGMSTDEAVKRGITATAGTVTSAAVVMVAVFSVFATLSLLDMKEMGVGLAVAVLLDATLVRAIALPAAMKLLGERNWYLPRALGWLPSLREPEPSPGRA
jgi:uncharacterized membrane protein YdfJ with MMPL/SSD domain